MDKKPPKIKKTKSSTPIAEPEDVVARLRVTPEVTIPGSKPFIPAVKAIRQMMIDRMQAADEIERLRLVILGLQAALAQREQGRGLSDYDTLLKDNKLLLLEIAQLRLATGIKADDRDKF